VANLVTQYQNAYGSIGVNGGNYGGYPIVTVPANQPDVPIAVSAGCNNFTSETGTEVPIPPSAVSGFGSDAPLIVNQPSTQTEWEFWQATDTNGSWSACWGGKLTNTASSSGVFPGTSGLSATGISYLGTAITMADIQSGSIDHAIAMIVVSCNGYVAPAVRTDCGSSAGQLPEGSRLRFPTGMAMPSGLTTFGKMVFTALQTYGAVVTDQGGAVMLQGETGNDWAYEGHSGTDPITASWNGQAEYSALNSMPWGQLQVLAP
jgi:hypothetical protein